MEISERLSLSIIHYLLNEQTRIVNISTKAFAIPDCIPIMETSKDQKSMEQVRDQA